MRKAQKKQAEDFVKLLGEAHNEIRAAIEKKNISVARSLLADCQDGAIALGNLIEAAEGEGFVTISLLESYCEAVYHVHEELEQGQAVSASKIYKALRQWLFRIESSVKNDIKVRLEAVFLPYKASMWDSLESVWKAADEDEDCDAYVIPIPYYDKNPDGSFKEMHYEGGEYPDYVPVVWYDDYDFESRRPDMIFIHNPYDECNIVTSVHPFFYSKNLKKFTDKLVYIPYFILSEVDPENELALKDIEKFCLVPGVVYADQVIVQSEDMRQAYINILTEFMSGQGRSRAYWEKKILGLGSPKVDKVLSTRKDDLEIPEEWMKVIRKPDGSWKKIIFYNTTVTALLQHNEQYLVKMRDVFRVFYENRDEVALLWRPHPLFASTIEAMRPGLGEAYREIVKRYREDGWGIYDDTSDMDRAVALSDAYYGDWSSVAWLYQIIEKPIMYQNVDVLSNQDDSLSIADIVRYNDKLFILTRDTYSLFEFDISTQKTKWCGTAKKQINQIFICMTVCEGKIYIAPYEADIIPVYDIEKGEFEYILLRQPDGKRKNKYYHLCFNHQQRVFFLGGLDSTMLSINVQNGIVSEITDWMEEFERREGQEAAIMTHTDKCIIEDCFWVALQGKNVLLQYNMITGNYQFWHVGDVQIQYTTINYDGRYFWLSGNRKIIIRWEKETGNVKGITHFPDGFEMGDGEQEALFYCCYPWNDAFYFAPWNSNMLIELNPGTGMMKNVLKNSDASFFCCELAEMNDSELYIEMMDKKGIRKSSYTINRKNGYCCHSIKADRKDEINCEMESTFVEENHSKYLNLFLVKQKLDEDLKERVSCVGQKICGVVIER